MKFYKDYFQQVTIFCQKRTIKVLQSKDLNNFYLVVNLKNKLTLQKGKISFSKIKQIFLTKIEEIASMAKMVSKQKMMPKQ